MNRSDISAWLNAAKFPITNEVLENRCAALNEILRENDYSYWVDIVKIFLGLAPNPKNEASFVKELQDNDDTFPRLKIEKQVVVQAAIALSCKIQLAIDFIDGVKPIAAKAVATKVEGEEDDEDGETTDTEPGAEDIDIAKLICLSLENASFLKQLKIETKVGLLEKIKEFRLKHITSVRDYDDQDHDDVLSEIESRLSEDQDDLNGEEPLKLAQALRSVIKRNNVFGEEQNILWWLFGEFSEIGNDYFGNINQEALAVITAREIHNLDFFNEEIPASPHIIRKVLSAGRKSGGSKVTTVKACISALSPQQKEKVIQGYEAKISELTPCLNMLKTGKDFGSVKEGKSKAEENIGHDVLALQIYREFNFLNDI